MIFDKLFFTCAILLIVSILFINADKKFTGRPYQVIIAIIGFLSIQGFVLFAILSIWF